MEGDYLKYITLLHFQSLIRFNGYCFKNLNSVTSSLQAKVDACLQTQY